MDTPTLPSRRAFLKGAVPAVAAGAIGLSAVPVAAQAEHPWITARRLAKELSQALADIETNPVAPGSSVAVVFPKGHPHGIGFADLDWYLENCKGPTAGMTAVQRRDYHLAEFQRACEELDPMIGHWSRLYHDEDDGRMSLHFPSHRQIRGRWLLRGCSPQLVWQARQFVGDTRGRRHRR